MQGHDLTGRTFNDVVFPVPIPGYYCYLGVSIFPQRSSAWVTAFLDHPMIVFKLWSDLQHWFWNKRPVWIQAAQRHCYRWLLAHAERDERAGRAIRSRPVDQYRTPRSSQWTAPVHVPRTTFEISPVSGTVDKGRPKVTWTNLKRTSFKGDPETSPSVGISGLVSSSKLPCRMLPVMYQ